MAPKRAGAAVAVAAKAESSASSFTLSSSDQDGGPQEDAQVVRLSSASAKKKPPQKQAEPAIKPSPNPPAAREDEGDSEEEEEGYKSSSGSGDEDGSSDEASESEDEKGTTLPAPTTPRSKPKLPQPLPNPTPAPPSDSGSDSVSSDGSDSGSDSSNESPASTPASRPSRAAGPSIKPINTRPMDASPKWGKRAPTPPRPSQERGSGKRKNEAAERLEPEFNQGGQKRQMFQRLWSLDDEIALLNGLVEYRNKKNIVPGSARDMEDLRDLIKGTVQAEASNTQLSDKVRRLKKKFETNAARAKNGAALPFSNSHDQKAYEVSKKVWGSNKSTSESVDDSDDSDDDEEIKNETKNNKKFKEHSDDLIAFSPNNTVKNDGRGIVKDKSRYPYLCEIVAKMAGEYLCGVAIKRALERLDDAKAKQMEEKLKRLGTTETKQHLRRVDLHKETVKLILESLSRSERSEQEQ